MFKFRMEIVMQSLLDEYEDFNTSGVNAKGFYLLLYSIALRTLYLSPSIMVSHTCYSEEGLLH